MPTSSKNLTILGASTSGLAVAQLANHLGYTAILVSEFNLPEKIAPALLDAFAQLPTVTLETGGHSQQCLTHAQTVVVSPGIPIKAPIIQQLKAQKPTVRVCSEVSWALEQMVSEKLISLGITGTNGKTTVTALTQWLLQQGGLSSVACGNIGLPVATVVLNALTQENPQPTTYAVMELSSYQLEYSDTLAHLATSGFTNFTPDHLDWHGGLLAYEQAKKTLFVGKLAPPWVVLNADDPTAKGWIAETTASVLAYSLTPENPLLASTTSALWIKGNTVWLREAPQVKPLCTVEGFQLKGSHNLENLLVAVGIAHLQGVSATALQAGIETFTAVAHRCERVFLPSHPDWQIYNDSKATNPEACMKALEGFPAQSVILIAGGKAKGTPLEAWASAVKRHCQTVILNGADQTCFQEALTAIGFEGTIHRVATQPEAVALALTQLETSAKESVVLLSPATASFDQFKHFEARGNAFKQQVLAWQTAPITPLSSQPTEVVL